MSTAAETRRGSEWLQSWDPENEETWDRRLAWTTLTITTFTLTLCFASWFLASAIAPKLTNLGFDLTQTQLYWLTSMPGLAGGIRRAESRTGLRPRAAVETRWSNRGNGVACSPMRTLASRWPA